MSKLIEIKNLVYFGGIISDSIVFLPPASGVRPNIYYCKDDCMYMSMIIVLDDGLYDDDLNHIITMF